MGISRIFLVKESVTKLENAAKEIKGRYREGKSKVADLEAEVKTLKGIIAD